MDYEVTEEEMPYAEGVHGFIQHSDHRHLRRFEVTMSEPSIDESYLTWLYSQVDTVKVEHHPAPTGICYECCIRQSSCGRSQTENRAKDSEDLRFTS